MDKFWESKATESFVKRPFVRVSDTKFLLKFFVYPYGQILSKTQIAGCGVAVKRTFSKGKGNDEDKIKITVTGTGGGTPQHPISKFFNSLT